MDQPDVRPADLAFTMSIILGSAIGFANRNSLLSVDVPRIATGLGGADRNRTDDLMLAKHALSQLSYGPVLSLGSSGGPGTS